MRTWLQANPLGIALAGLSGLLVLVSLVLGWAWNRPVSSDGAGEVEAVAPAVEMPPQLAEMQPLEAYQVIIERPVFNQSRRPEAESGNGTESVVATPDVQAANLEVRLTGVVLTPEMKIVTLTPEGGKEALIVREGTALEGEQVGWSVSRIDARQVTLDASDGRSMQLDLAVHDQAIAEPPKPEPPPETSQEAQAEAVEGQPLSRAEEIRQRIQERREQLRREAEASEDTEAEDSAETRASYQDAIRQLMQQNRQAQEEETSDENEQ